MHVRPAASRERVRGWRSDGSLALEVTAAPEHGRANRAVEKLLAAVLGIAAGRVTVARGERARSKRVEVEGMSAEDVKRRIDAALESTGEGAHDGGR